MSRVAIIGSHGFIGFGLRAHLDKCLIGYTSFSNDFPFFTKETKRIFKDENISDIVFLATELNPIRAKIEAKKVENELKNLAKMLEFIVDILPEVNFIFPSSGGRSIAKAEKIN